MANLFQKTAYLTIFAASFFSATAQEDSTVYFQVKKIIDDTRLQYAPDKRTKLLELTNVDIANNAYNLLTSEHTLTEKLQQQLSPINGKFAITTLPDTSIGDKQKGLVNLSVANLRTQPSHSAEMATQVLLGASVDILQKEDGDYRVRTPEGYIAWVPTSSIVPVSTQELVKWQTSTRIIYTAEFGRSYSDANSNSQRVSDLVFGDILTVLAEQGHFYKVAYPDQRIAFVPKKEATLFADWIKTRKASADDILASAKSMLGLPYLWGGTSVKGVDCSGFTKTSYFMNGYVIPRDASQQVLYGDPIDILDSEGNFDTEKALKNLKPADLLFFAGDKQNNPNARVTHVALYIGNGTFIQAAGTVRINSILKTADNYDDFQTRTVVAARRYLGSKDPAVQKISDNTYYIQK